MSIADGVFSGCSCCAPASGRRRFLATGLAALAAPMIGPGLAHAATNPAPVAIDVHHHIMPPALLAALHARNLGDGPLMNWTVEKSLADMDASGVRTAMISMPNSWIPADPAIMGPICHASNEYAAGVRDAHKGRFGLFAMLPLPNIDACLAEIAYALDVLKADGFGLMTDYNDKWLGDPAFAPVMDELNRRGAVVYTHPKALDCCRLMQPYMADAAIEYGTDTTRTIGSLLFQGTAKRCPDIRFIFSHGGGTMPFLIERFKMIPVLKPDSVRMLPPGGVVPALQSFHYDIAQTTDPIPLGALLKLVGPRQVMFGSDFPYRTSSEHIKSLKAYGLKPGDLRLVEDGNALRLMPQLKARG